MWRNAGTFARELLLRAIEIALRKSARSRRHGSWGAGEGDRRRVADVAGALAHPGPGVAVHQAAAIGLGLGVDRRQTRRRRRDHDGLLRQANATLVQRLRVRASAGDKRGAHDEAQAQAILRATSQDKSRNARYRTRMGLSTRRDAATDHPEQPGHFRLVPFDTGDGTA